MIKLTMETLTTLLLTLLVLGGCTSVGEFLEEAYGHNVFIDPCGTQIQAHDSLTYHNFLIGSPPERDNMIYNYNLRKYIYVNIDEPRCMYAGCSSSYEVDYLHSDEELYSWGYNSRYRTLVYDEKVLSDDEISELYAICASKVKSSTDA